MFGKKKTRCIHIQHSICSDIGLKGSDTWGFTKKDAERIPYWTSVQLSVLPEDGQVGWECSKRLQRMCSASEIAKSKMENLAISKKSLDKTIHQFSCPLNS